MKHVRRATTSVVAVAAVVAPEGVEGAAALAAGIPARVVVAGAAVVVATGRYANRRLPIDGFRLVIVRRRESVIGNQGRDPQSAIGKPLPINSRGSFDGLTPVIDRRSSIKHHLSLF
jgi:hypothetical protein